MAGTPTPGAPKATAAEAAGTGASVAISAIDQYFTLIESALYSIENIAAQRLSSVGSYAPDALISEIKAIQKQQDDAKTDADKTAAAKANAATVVSEAKPELDVATKTSDITTVTPPNTNALVAVTSKALPSVLNADNTPRTLSNELPTKLKTPGTLLDLDSNGDLQVVAASHAQQTDIQSKIQKTAAQHAVTATLLHIGQLQPKLNECVLRAKL